MAEVPQPTPTRARILEAALACFIGRGVSGTTIAEIGARSQASVGSIYHHFTGGKEGIAAAVYTEALENYQAGMVSALRGSPGASAGIGALVRHHLGWVRENADRARYLLAYRDPDVAHAAAQRVGELNQAAFAELGAWYRGHVAAGRLHEVPIDVFYAAVIGPAQEFSRLWLAGRTETSIAETQRILVGAAQRAVRSVDAPG